MGVSEINDARRQVLDQSSANKQLRRQVVELKKATAQNENFEKQNQIFNQRRLKVSTEYSPEEDTAMNLAEEALIESKTLEDSISEHRQALQEERAELEAVSERGSLERLNSERLEQELKPIVAQVSLLEKEWAKWKRRSKATRSCSTRRRSSEEAVSNGSDVCGQEARRHELPYQIASPVSFATACKRTAWHTSVVRVCRLAEHRDMALSSAGYAVFHQGRRECWWSRQDGLGAQCS